MDSSQRGGPFGVPVAGDFRCGRCGTELDGGTDEPVAARDMRAALERVEKLAVWINRDRREPDKVVAYAQEITRITGRALRP